MVDLTVYWPPDNPKTGATPVSAPSGGSADPFAGSVSYSPPSTANGDPFAGSVSYTPPANQASQPAQPEPAAPTSPPQDSSGPGIPTTIVDQGMQGLTAGFGNMVSDRIAAGIASSVTGEPYDDMLKEAQTQTKQDLASEMANHPVISVGSQLVGGLLAGGAAAEMAGAGAAAAGNLPGAGAVANIAGKVGGAIQSNPLTSAIATGTKNAVLGAVTGGIYGAGTADPGERTQGLENGALVGGVTGLAAPVLGAVAGSGLSGAANIGRGLVARSGEALDGAVSTAKQAAQDLYQKSEKAGAVLEPHAGWKLASTLDKIVPDADTEASKSLYSKTLSAINDFKSDIAKGPVKLETLDRHRQILGNLAKDITNPNKAQEAEMADRAVEAIDKHVSNLTGADIKNKSREGVDALNAARAGWAKYRKMEAVADLIKNAEGDPSKIKAAFKSFAKNPKKTLGLSPKEFEAIHDVAKKGLGYKTLRSLGALGFDLDPAHILGSLGGAAAEAGLAEHAAGSAGDALAIAGATTAAGTAARAAQKLLARGQAENAMRELERRGMTPSVLAKMSPKAALAAIRDATSAVMRDKNAGLALEQSARRLQPAQIITSNYGHQK